MDSVRPEIKSHYPGGAFGIVHVGIQVSPRAHMVLFHCAMYV